MSTDAKFASFQETFQWTSLSLRAKGPVAFMSCCMVLISALLFYSYWNSWRTNLVFEMANLKREQKALQDEIAAVRAQIAVHESLAVVESKATALGLRYDAKQISALPIAYRNGAAPTPALASRAARLASQFAPGTGEPGQWRFRLNALVVQFQDWVEAPYTTP
jgi:hypothetical protein